MKFNDFYEYPKGVSQGAFASKKPKLENVQVVKFVRGSAKMFWKGNHSDFEFESALFLQKKYEKNIGKNLFTQCKENRGVKTSKKENIIKVLCPHMKERSRQFWYDLHINESSPDLISERDASEDCDESD